MFHFNQAIHRKITDLGVKNDYLNDASVRDYCHQLMALSLMPMNEVANQFQRLRTVMPAKLSGLLTYFEHQWMFGVVPLRMWNFSESNHRTNNTSEGKYLLINIFPFKDFSSDLLIIAYNLRFSTRLSKKHPNIWSFIQLIQNEHVRVEHVSIQLDAGASAPKQSSKTKSFQARFDTLQNRFLKKEMSATELLPGLSLLIGKRKK